MKNKMNKMTDDSQILAFLSSKLASSLHSCFITFTQDSLNLSLFLAHVSMINYLIVIIITIIGEVEVESKEEINCQYYLEYIKYCNCHFLV